MSHIPNSAMPHAGEQSLDQNQASAQDQSETSSVSTSAFSQIADKAREYPKATIAAGAAVAAGVVAAAAVGIRSRSGGKGKKSEA